MAAALAPLPASRPGQAVQQPLAMAPSTAGAGPSAVQPLAIAAPSSKPAGAAGLASGGLSPISEVASVEVGHTAFALCVCSAAFVVKTVPLLAAPQEEAPAPQSDGPLKSSSAASVRPAKHVSPASWPLCCPSSWALDYNTQMLVDLSRAHDAFTGLACSSLRLLLSVLVVLVLNRLRLWRRSCLAALK